LSAEYVSVIFMSILVYLVYMLHFTQNYADLKLFQFMFGISINIHCCQWSVVTWSKLANGRHHYN